MSSLHACIASLVGTTPSGDARLWLASRGLGLVPIADARDFAWAGPWIAIRENGDACVMFGVPSAPVFEPAGPSDAPIAEGLLLAPLDVSLWTPPKFGDPGTGVVEALLVAPDKQAPVQEREAVTAVVGRGLEGDRYFEGRGTFASGRPGSELTLIDAAVLDELGPIDHRRNVVVRGVDLNALVGREFSVGEVRCRGERLAEPCAVLDRANGGGVLRPLVHRAGLRASLRSGGTISVGDRVAPG
ncbi:MAG TPA: MOSC domain-containing protein [Solirubrobacteraceae bacterium]